MTDFEALLHRLVDGQVQFVIVGGFAASALGSARVTLDLDVVYARDADNLRRLAAALAPIHPYLRGAPQGLPFRLDVDTLRRGLNFTLRTDVGDLDLLGEIAGGGNFQTLSAGSVEIELFGLRCRCIGLDELIAAKRAAGRPRDLEAVAELEVLREERDRSGA